MSFQGLGAVQAIAVVGLAGMLAKMGAADVIVSARNKNPQAKQVTTITVGGSFAAGNSYTCTVDGNSFSYTSVSGDTNNDGVASAIKSELEQDPIFGALFTYTVATNVVTATARWPGRSITVASGTNLTLATTTAAASANPIGFGKVAVITDESQDAPYCAQAVSTLFSAQVDTHAVSYDASVVLGCEVEVEGQTITCEHTMATDAATSVEALKTELNTQLDALFGAGKSIVATRSSDSLVLTSELAGRGFKSRVYFGPGRDTGAVTSTSTRGTATAIQECRAGLALFSHSQERTQGESGATQWAANSQPQIVMDGIVLVSNSQDPDADDKVYVELGASNSYGALYNSHDTNRTLLPGWRWRKNNASADLVEVQVKN